LTALGCTKGKSRMRMEEPCGGRSSSAKAKKITAKAYQDVLWERRKINMNVQKK